MTLPLSKRLDMAGNYIPYQVCPVCNGAGMIKKPIVTTTSACDEGVFLCDVCEGRKVIPMYKSKPQIEPNPKYMGLFSLFIFVTMGLFLFGAIVFSSHSIKRNVKGVNSKTDSLTNIVIEMKKTIDTTVVIQAKHFGECSFISNEDIGIGYDGHLYSIDWRRRHGREPK